MWTKKLFKAIYDIDIGDLVRLDGDDEMLAGLGLVVDIKLGTEDLMDFIEAIRLPDEKDDMFDLFLNKPQVAVFWWHRKEPTKGHKPAVWFPIEEVVLLGGEE